jgi:hypothetical protein
MIRNDLPKSEEYVRKMLIPYRHCKRCKAHVLKSELIDYKYQCLYCDEDLYTIETYLDKEKKEISDNDFNDLIELVNNIMEFDNHD